MLADQAFKILERPDWVLHLPPTPVHDLTLDIDDLWTDQQKPGDDTLTSPRLAYEALGKALNELETREDGQPAGLKKLVASFPYEPLKDAAHLLTCVLLPLDGDRKIRLPKTWLKVIENSFRYENDALDGDASEEAREMQQYLAQHPNAALQAEEQSLSHWLIAADSGIEWNRKALCHGLVRLDLSSCRLNASSIPALVSYIEGNGSLRRLNLSNNRLLQEPGPAALLARSFRSSVVASLGLSSNPVDLKAASLHAFLSNLNSTTLLELRLSNILSEPNGDLDRWDYYDSGDSQTSEDSEDDSEDAESWEDVEEDEEDEDEEQDQDEEDEEDEQDHHQQDHQQEHQEQQQDQDQDHQEEEEEEEDGDDPWQQQKEDQAILALSAFIRRSILSRGGVEDFTGGGELAPSFCGCPNLIQMTWKGNESLCRTPDGRRAPQKHNFLIALPALAGHMVHLGHETAAAMGRVPRPIIGNQPLRMTFEAMNEGWFQGHTRLLIPSGIHMGNFFSGDKDPSRLSIDTAQIKDMFRGVRIARQDALRTTASESLLSVNSGAEANRIDLETAVDLDTKEYQSAIEASISLGVWRAMVYKMRHMRQDALCQEVQRSAFIVLAAARTLACQIEPLTPTREKVMPGWLRLPPEIRSLCVRFLDEIDIPGYGDLKIGHALSESQMQAILSFASDRRTIGYGRVNEVLLASERLADEAAMEAKKVTPSDESSEMQSRIAVPSTMVPSDIFAAPKWSWKKAAERCMPQDFVTQIAFSDAAAVGFPVPRVAVFEARPKDDRKMPPEALAFLKVTDCRALRHV